jgi:hypothetical protein
MHAIQRSSKVRRTFASIAALAFAALALHSIPAPAQGDALTGNMAPFSYLLGGPWNCSTSVPAMGSQPAHTDQGTATFEVVPGNVVHNHVATPMYSGDFYFGYSTRMNSYWQTDADNQGGHAFLTSTDGRTYTGTSSMGPMSMQDTVTYAKLAPNKVTVHEVISGTGQQAVFDSVCAR